MFLIEAHFLPFGPEAFLDMSKSDCKERDRAARTHQAL
jgi:hypothetical protein